MDDQISIPSPPSLNKREDRALTKWQKTEGHAPLSMDVALAMYELFLHGYSCDEIERVYHSKGSVLPLGAIVEARVNYQWDDARMQARRTAMQEVAERVRATQVNAVNFIGDILEAAHKEHGDKTKLFLSTGNPKDQSELSIKTATAYQNAVALWMKLTGQDKDKSASSLPVPAPVQPNEVAGERVHQPRKLNGANANDLLKLVDGIDD